MVLYNPDIFLEGSRQYTAASQAEQERLSDTFKGIAAGMQRRKELEEAKLERKRQEALAEQIRQQEIMRADRAAAMKPEALLAKSLRGERLTPEESSVLGAFDVLRTSQRSIDPITGETYQKYASVSGGAPAMAAAPRAGSRELLTAGEVEPSAGSFEMLRSMGGGVEISPVTGEPLLPPPSLDASTETFKQQKMREYAPQPQPRVEAPAFRAPSGLPPKQAAELEAKYQEMVMEKSFEQSLTGKEKKEQAQKSLAILDDMIEANQKTLPIAYAGIAQPITRLLSKDAAQNMAVLKQGRLRLAAPLAKQLGTNPTDKDFQATLDQIFNENESRETREQMLLEAKKFIAGDAGIDDFYKSINSLSEKGASTRKRFNPETGMLE